MFDLAPHIDDITDLVRSASRLALGWHRRPMVVENKLGVGFDPVTEADRAVEDAIRAGLGERFPDHAILGEERGASGAGPCRWVIDPIDGTRAFISGQPMWGTLLGFEFEGRAVAGWMHLPVLDESYVATTSGGHLVAGSLSRPLQASGVTDLDAAILLSTHPDMFAPGPDADRYGRLAASVRLTRFSGDCMNYGLLATGTADLVVENGLAAYDIIPLIPILEASGAVVTDINGGSARNGGYVVAAATPELHARALDILNR